MSARSSHDAHRAATPLELFFDLVFVVAIAQAAGALPIGEGHAADGLAGYLMVFFAIWWAWMKPASRRCSSAGCRAEPSLSGTS